MRKAIKKLIDEDIVESVDAYIEKRIVEILSHPKFNHDGFIDPKHTFYKKQAAKVIMAMIKQEGYIK